MQEMWVQSLDQDDPLEKEMATHSSILAYILAWARIQARMLEWVAYILAYILAWAISRTEEPGGLQSAKELDVTCGLNNKTHSPPL